MRIEDAPREGWYPDPEGSTRLRWWDGLDWTDRFRPYPTDEETAVRAMATAAAPRSTTSGGGAAGAGWYPDPAGSGSQRWWDGTQWTEQMRGAGQMVEQVRDAVREEAQRVASQFGAQARRTVRDVTPLISDYTNRATRFLKRLIFLAVVLVIAWFVFQAYANMTFFDWLGDRIDNLTDNRIAGQLAAGRSAGGWSAR